MNNETSEIVRLTERIAKDPKSKLFVPLAEEHKKAGDLEMAIHVLLEGLKNNPGYVTARAFLGKLLLAKGDFSGAQKEFDEVVKTMPDNFMAQRSLGDLLILQNRPHDALTYYNVALSLNPHDEELVSMISDIEAGRDVRLKIQLSKTQSSAEQAVKEEPSASLAVRKPAPAVDSLQALKVEQVKPAELTVAAQAAAPPFAETPPAPASLMTETEEPEEVLIVEPLESAEAFALEPTKSEAAVPGEQELEPVPSVAAEEPFNFDFSSQSHEEAETVLKEDISAEQDLFQEMDAEKTPPSIFEETGAEAIFEPGAGEEVSEKAPEKAFEDGSEKSDDFTTDTLAELYIAQGFYEKAIEIYERMLSDKPNSRGLQDKLAGVRAHAAQAAAPATEEIKGTDMPAEPEAREYVPAAASSAVPEESSVFDEPKEYRPQQDLAAEGFKPAVFAEAREYIPTVESEEIVLEAEVVSEPGEFKPEEPSPGKNVFAEFGESPPVTEPGEQLPAGGDAGFEASVHAPVKESTRTRPQDTAFEPREYLPPKSVREPLKPIAAKGKAAQNLPPAGRKETIARLETWLTNIKKEK